MPECFLCFVCWARERVVVVTWQYDEHTQWLKRLFWSIKMWLASQHAVLSILPFLCLRLLHCRNNGSLTRNGVALNAKCNNIDTVQRMVLNVSAHLLKLGPVNMQWWDSCGMGPCHLQVQTSTLRNTLLRMSSILCFIGFGFCPTYLAVLDTHTFTSSKVFPSENLANIVVWSILRLLEPTQFRSSTENKGPVAVARTNSAAIKSRFLMQAFFTVAASHVIVLLLHICCILQNSFGSLSIRSSHWSAKVRSLACVQHAICRHVWLRVQKFTQKLL